MLCGKRLACHNKVNCRAAAREGGLGRSVSEIIPDLSISYQYYVVNGDASMPQPKRLPLANTSG